GRDLGSPAFNQSSVTLDDQLVSNETVSVQRLKFVCVPVDTNGQGIIDPNTNLVCYQVAGANLDPRPRVDVSTQFQTSRFELKKPKLLCSPGAQTLAP